MQTINNREISSTEYFNKAEKLYEEYDNIAFKYIGLALTKVSIVIRTKIYSADTPEDSSFKKGAKYIGRTFFNVAKAIDKISYLGASSVALSAGIITNYISAENTASNKYATPLIYFGIISSAAIISCSFFNSLNVAGKDIVPKLNYMIAHNDFCTAAYNFIDSIQQQLNDLNAENRLSEDERITISAEVNSKINNLKMQLNELIILVSNSQNETDNSLIMDLLARMNPSYTTARENEIIAYDKLNLYTGSNIDPKTLTMISNVAFKDAKQPVFCENQIYEYKHLVTWHKMPYPNIDATCPHNRNKLIWSDVQRIKKPELIAMD
jgi:hypothetical protein